jgi:hypothetical protein
MPDSGRNVRMSLYAFWKQCLILFIRVGVGIAIDRSRRYRRLDTSTVGLYQFGVEIREIEAKTDHQLPKFSTNQVTYSLIPIRSSRRAVNGHQYRETMADHNVPMMTAEERWKAIVVTSISLSRVL